MREAPTARLKEIRLQLLRFNFNQAELELLRKDIALQVEGLKR